MSIPVRWCVPVLWAILLGTYRLMLLHQYAADCRSPWGDWLDLEPWLELALHISWWRTIQRWSLHQNSVLWCNVRQKKICSTHHKQQVYRCIQVKTGLSELIIKYIISWVFLVELAARYVDWIASAWSQCSDPTGRWYPMCSLYRM